MFKIISKNFIHKINFLENTVNEASLPEKWEVKFQSYAEIKPIYETSFSQIESKEFGHIMTESLFIFRLRYIKNISTKLRIEFKKRTFEIRRIVNIDEKDRLLNIIALEIF